MLRRQRWFRSRAAPPTGARTSTACRPILGDHAKRALPANPAGRANQDMRAGLGRLCAGLAHSICGRRTLDGLDLEELGPRQVLNTTHVSQHAISATKRRGQSTAPPPAHVS